MKKNVFIIFVLSQMLCCHLAFSQERPDVQKSKAVLLMNEGKFKEALSILEGIKGRISDPDFLFMLGVAYQRNSRFTESASTLKQFAAIKPNSEDYHYYLGYALYNLKESDAALEEFNKSDIFGLKTDASSYYSGMIYFEKKDYAKALPFFIKALEVTGDYENAAHYYAGICLYKDGIGEGGIESLEYSLYHFEKVLKDNSDISKESRRYIEVIREYLETGAIRQKKRLEIGLRAELFYSSNRTANPIDGIPFFGVDTGRQSLCGNFTANVAAAPLMYDTFGLFLSYGFAEDIGFTSLVNTSSTQKHVPGLSFQFFNEERTMEARLDYRYELNFLDSDKVRKIDFAHAVEASYTNSFTDNWAMGIRLPFRMHNGVGGAWGDFTAKSIEVILLSYHYFGNTSIRFEPSVLFFMPNATSVIPKFTYYSFAAKFNLPWKMFFVWPSLKVAPGIVSRATGSSTVYDFGLSFYRPLGLGARMELANTIRKGYVSNTWEFITGLALEYTY